MSKLQGHSAIIFGAATGVGAATATAMRLACKRAKVCLGNIFLTGAQ